MKILVSKFTAFGGFFSRGVHCSSVTFTNCGFLFIFYFQIFFAIICAAAASPSPQLFPNAFSPLLARDIPAPEAPANTVHASHVAALTPAYYYAAPYPYYAVRFIQAHRPNVLMHKIK